MSPASLQRGTSKAFLFLVLATLALQVSWVLPLLGLAETPVARHLVRIAVKWSLFVVFLEMMRSPAGRLTWQELGFRNRSWRERFVQLALGVALTAPVVALFVVSPDLQNLVLRNLSRADTSRLGSGATGTLPASAGLLFGVLAVAFTAAFVEELFWRGYALAVLPARVGMFWAVTVASALFGLTHTYLGWTAVALTFVGGIALSVIFLWKRSLLLNIAIHFLFDVAGPLYVLTRV